MASALWNSSSAQPWHDVRQDARSILKQHGKEGLPELEAWIQDELPVAVLGRQPVHLTKDEVAKLVRWKLRRGKMRPSLQGYADALQPSAVVSATTAGFKHLRPITSGTGDAASDADDSSVEAAMKELTVLRGVGPATASAMMMLVDGSCPYMSDEALGLFSGGKALKYTPKAYGEMRGKLKGKAEELRRQTGEGSWTAAEVEHCLFYAQLRAQPAAGTSKGRQATKQEAAADAAEGGGSTKQKKWKLQPQRKKGKKEAAAAAGAALGGGDKRAAPSGDAGEEAAGGKPRGGKRRRGGAA